MATSSRPSTPTRRSRRQRSVGQAIVEFALVFPVFLLLLLIAIDAGRLYFSLIQVHNAAREGAAAAAVSPTDTAAITARALRETNAQAQQGEHPVAIDVSCSTASGSSLACASAPGGTGAGNTITVQVAERFTFLTPFVNDFFDDDFSMAASATAGVLAYAAPGGGSAPGPCPPPQADFTVTVTSGTTVSADPSASTPNSGICNISGYTWQWGDGKDDVGSATGDSHAYVVADTYTIRLTVTNQAGPASTTRDVTVPVGPPPPTCAAPKASFTWVKNGKTVSFNDTSFVADPVGCPVTNWAWDFGDGILGNAQNPLHTYANSKAHTVTLVATNAGGASGACSHAV